MFFPVFTSINFFVVHKIEKWMMGVASLVMLTFSFHRNTMLKMLEIAYRYGLGYILITK